MKDFDGKKITIEEAFGKTYKLPYFQREYAWDTSHMCDLLDDLTGEFLSWYRVGDSVDDIEGRYGHYYLGSIIIDSSYRLVDGQQRLTSLSLLLIYLMHRLKGIDDDLADDVKRLVFRKSLGSSKPTFVIDVADRADCMRALLADEVCDAGLQGNESVEALLGRYEDIKRCFPAAIDDAALPVFVSWLGINVHVVRIVADNNNDAYRMFSTQNDRGKPLSQLEMLKADILSSIDEDRQHEKNEQWKTVIAKVKVGDPAGKNAEAEDARVMQILLMARYAQTVVTQEQMKRKVDRRSRFDGDFGKISSNFYRWTLTHKDVLRLEKPNDYCAFVDEYDHFSDAYIRLKDAVRADHPIDGLENVYHLDERFMTALFYTVILSPVQPGDSVAVANKKMNLMARLVDIFHASYCFRGWGLNETNYEAFFQETAKAVRWCSVPQIKCYCDALCRCRSYYEEDFLSHIKNLAYPANKGRSYKNLKWILGRVTAFVETVDGKPDLTKDYLDKGCHIEHVISDHVEQWQQLGFSSEEEFTSGRNNVAALLLLQGSVNSGLGDKAFQEKLEAYCSPIGNSYAASLAFGKGCTSPALKKLRNKGVPFEAYEVFGKQEIAHRQTVLNELCKLIWNAHDFELTEAEAGELGDWKMDEGFLASEVV